MPTIKHSLGTGPYQMEWTSVSTQNLCFYPECLLFAG